MVWPYAPRPEASASASRPHFSTVVIVAQPHAAGDRAFVAVVVFILLPCWYRVRFVLLCAFMDLWLSGSIIRLVRRRSGIGEFGNALLGYGVGEHVDPDEIGGGRVDDIRAGERHRPAIGAVRAYVTDGKRCGDVLRRSGEQLIH